MNSSLVNKVVDVLVENLTDDKSKAFGRSEYMTSVIFNGKKSDIGKIVKVRIKDSNRNSLFGEIETNSDQKVA
jgi:tRNA-2-methylthio-N6-dimethylallyladenosine synthase